MNIDNFDWEYYLKKNKDLQKNGVNTKELLWHHWVEFGSIEKRKFRLISVEIDDFDWEYYIEKHSDLRQNNINTKESAWTHWITFGMNEKRKMRILNYNSVSDSDSATESESDSDSDSEYELESDSEEEEYIFDWKYYIKKNNDLKKIGIKTKSDAWNHWKKYGKNEQRPFRNKIIEHIVEQIDKNIVTKLDISDNKDIVNLYDSDIIVPDVDIIPQKNIIPVEIYIPSKFNKNIQYDSNKVYLFIIGDFEYTEKDISDLYSDFIESKSDVLSPVVINRDKQLLYYGTVKNNDEIVILNETTIKYTDICVKKREFVKKVSSFYPKFFMTNKKDLVKNYLYIKDVIDNFKLFESNNYNISMTSFVTVKENINTIENNEIKNKEIKQNLLNNIKNGLRSVKYSNNNTLYYEDSSLQKEYILICDTFSNSLYVLNLIKCLQKMNFNIHYINCDSQEDKKPDTEYIKKLQKLGVYIEFLQENNSQQNILSKFLKNNCNVYKYIFVSYYEILLENYNTIRRFSAKSKLVYISHVYLPDNKISLVQKCDIVLVISNNDYEDLINKEIKNIFYLPISYEIKNNIEYNISNRKDIFYICNGKLNNLRSIQYFLDSIFGRILEINNTITLHLYGDFSKKLIKYKSKFNNNLIIDSNAPLDTMRLFIIPLLFGGDIENLILDTVINKIPIISSNFGLQNLNFFNLEDILILDILYLEPDEFVNKFISYYNNINLLKSISINSYNNIKNNFSNEKCIKSLDNIFSSVNIQQIEKSSIKKNKICVIWTKYNDNISSITKYFDIYSNESEFDIYILHDKEEIYDNIHFIKSDEQDLFINKVQLCIDYLIKTNTLDKYDSFAIYNDPKIEINNITHDTFKFISENNVSCGNIIPLEKTYIIDNFILEELYDTNIIFFNKKFLKILGNNFIKYNINDVFEVFDENYTDIVFKINSNKIAKEEIFRKTNKNKECILALLNEYYTFFKMASLTNLMDLSNI